MFTRKKRLVERKEFYIALVAILGVGYLMGNLFLSPEDTDQKDNVSAKVSQTVKQNQDKADNISENRDMNSDEVSENSDINSDNSVQENQSGEYYLVKESDGVIKVYRYDENGEESLLKKTDILFSLLSEEDQELFSKGVVVQTDDELLELLQDFES
ncbi:hypothetical protein [Aminipila luticellarii]|uniref:Bypass of forespore C C-terminal domain-containing protein n=1 Tax=Aminipila luticellarii TaxID=2507160 RepID=A0A410PV49_9FIRM|nr:hypothetical protein [Aminipila luticellarii]QAT42829.1 hypothetical protein EQM06_06045 [Aminipila luticellarii]